MTGTVTTSFEQKIRNEIWHLNHGIPSTSPSVSSSQLATPAGPLPFSKGVMKLLLSSCPAAVITCASCGAGIYDERIDDYSFNGNVDDHHHRSSHVRRWSGCCSHLVIVPPPAGA